RALEHARPMHYEPLIDAVVPVLAARDVIELGRPALARPIHLRRMRQHLDMNAEVLSEHVERREAPPDVIGFALAGLPLAFEAVPRDNLQDHGAMPHNGNFGPVQQPGQRRLLTWMNEEPIMILDPAVGLGNLL